MKKCYIITFELKNPGINQQNLVDTIKSAKNWARLSPTSFILTANKTATEVRDILLKQLPNIENVGLFFDRFDSAPIGISKYFYVKLLT